MKTGRLVTAGIGMLLGITLFAAWERVNRVAPDAPEFLAAAERDAGEAANDMRRACRWVRAADREGCYLPYLRILGTRSLARALDVMVSLTAMDRAAHTAGHAMAHTIGSAGWDGSRDLRAVVADCRPLYQAGCYHGAIHGALLAHAPIDSSLVAGLCAGAAGEDPPPWLPFQCAHGLGHGLVTGSAGDLPTGLAACDWLGGDWERQVCYGGAFMENIGTDHSVAHLHDAAPHHLTTWQRRDPEDPLYPCSVLDARYGYACYQTQGAIILELNGVDYPAAVATCLTVPPDSRAPCLTGLGVSANTTAEDDPVKALEVCTRWPANERRWCFAGVARNRIDIHADATVGLAFCAEVPEGGDREFCLAAAREEGRLFPD